MEHSINFVNFLKIYVRFTRIKKGLSACEKLSDKTENTQVLKLAIFTFAKKKKFQFLFQRKRKVHFYTKDKFYCFQQNVF